MIIEHMVTVILLFKLIRITFIGNNPLPGFGRSCVGLAYLKFLDSKEPLSHKISSTHLLRQYGGVMLNTSEY